MTFEAINWNKVEGLIDHQQAVEAVQGAILGINVLTAERALTVAAPHLRAETVDRLKNFRNDYQHTYAIPGDPYADGYLTACNAIIALLEGGGEDK